MKQGLNRLVASDGQGNPVGRVDDRYANAVSRLAAKQRDGHRDASAEMSQSCSLLLQRRIGRLTWVLAGLAVVAAWKEGSSLLQAIGEYLGL